MAAAILVYHIYCRLTAEKRAFEKKVHLSDAIVKELASGLACLYLRTLQLINYYTYFHTGLD